MSEQNQDLVVDSSGSNVVSSDLEFTETLVSIRSQLEVANAHLSYLVNMNFLFLVCLGAYVICAIWYKVVKSFI